MALIITYVWADISEFSLNDFNCPSSPRLRRDIFREAKNGGKGITLPLVHPKLCPGVDLPPRLSGFGGKGIRTPDFQLAKLALYQLSYAPGRELRNVDCRSQIAIGAPHQIRTRCSGATNILSLDWILNASYQTSLFRAGPITRN